MDRNNVVNKYLKDHLTDVEGYSTETYDDQKGIETVGKGLNLRSPATTASLLRLGHDPEAVKTGAVSLSDEDLGKAEDDVINQKRELFNNIKSQGFPQKEFNEAQEAAMLSLVYNSPQLLGPNLRQRLNENDDLGAMKEILLNSNKEQSPGIQLRRLKEAEMYGGPLDFQQLLKTMNPEEKKQVYNMLGKIQNEEQKTEALKKYEQFNPDYKPPMEKPVFFKMPKLLKGN